MTDKMTDEQVNEAIFKVKGWISLKGRGGYASHENTVTGFRGRYFDTPDYCHDWRLCGELLEEMAGACVARDGIDGWYCGFGFSDYIDVYFEMGRGDFGSEADTPQRAICEAWLAWKAGDNAN